VARKALRISASMEHQSSEAAEGTCGFLRQKVRLDSLDYDFEINKSPREPHWRGFWRKGSLHIKKQGF
jgi:hypothetical protein